LSITEAAGNFRLRIEEMLDLGTEQCRFFSDVVCFAKSPSNDQILQVHIFTCVLTD